MTHCMRPRKVFLLIAFLVSSCAVISLLRNRNAGRSCTEDDLSFLRDEKPRKRAEKPRNRSPLIFNANRRHLLVLFTTFKASSRHHAVAHRLVIANWISFGEAVRPVLFANLTESNPDDGRLVEDATRHGWDVLPVPSTNRYGTPHLRPMFEEVARRYDSSFYGYANGDLLFTDDLVASLRFLKLLVGRELNDNAMLVGRRTDVRLCSEAVSVTSPVAAGAPADDPVSMLLEVHFAKSNLPSLAGRGELREPFAIDYFVFARGNSTFDWSETANVVVGRRAYDQYLVAAAEGFGVNTVDMTDSVLAAHLSKPGTRDTGFDNADSEYNLDLVGRSFPYDRGLTSSTRYRLRADRSRLPAVLRLERRLPGWTDWMLSWIA